MALGATPSRDDIYNELSESTYRNGGNDFNHLSDMYDYVFGAGSYSRSAFANTGIPDGSNLVASDAIESIDVQFDIDDLGGADTTAVAEYWTSGQTSPPYSTNYQELGTYSSTGTKNATITGLAGGQSYDVRIIFYNTFNNGGDYPNAPNDKTYFNTTNTDTALSEQDKLTTPTVQAAESSAGGGFSVQEVYMNISASGNQDDIRAEVRVNGGTANENRDCAIDVTTTSPEAVYNANTFFGDTDTVEVRVKLTSTSQTDSDWSNWTTVSHLSSTKSCPL